MNSKLLSQQNNMENVTAQEKWIDVCALEDIPLRGSIRANIQGIVTGLFRTVDGEIFAIENSCPHKGGPLSDGIVHDTSVTCPLHGWVFDLKTGQAKGEDSGCVKTFAIKTLDGRVWVQVEG